MLLTRNHENLIINVLGGPVGRQLIGLLNAGAPVANAQPVVPPLINNAAPVYIANTNYADTINGVAVTHLTITAVQEFWELTMSLLPKHIHALRGEGITHPKDLAQFNSTEFESVYSKHEE